jgi:hypothetical protein
MAIPALKPRRAATRAVTASATEREVERQRILSTRICDLDLTPDGVLLECIDEVKRELKARGISFVPQFYLGDDDFWTADKGISVNVPWYLANATLWRMVNDHLFVYSRREVLMYLRHETGHALNYAFELWRRKDWVNTFGDFNRPYRDVYNPNPWSRDYVRYLHRAGMYHYAQKHPDEDWAETFAVWLDQGSRWRYRYRDWQVALAKLEYVDRVIEVEGACSEPPPNERPGLRIPYTEIKETVAESFRINDAVDPDLAEYRHDLLEIFPRGRARMPGHGSNQQSAARFIQQHQRLLTERLAGWIGDSDRRVIAKFLRQLEAICTQERLVVPDSRRQEKLVDLTIVATWHVVDGIHRLSG